MRCGFAMGSCAHLCSRPSLVRVLKGLMFSSGTKMPLRRHASVVKAGQYLCIPLVSVSFRLPGTEAHVVDKRTDVVYDNQLYKYAIRAVSLTAMACTGQSWGCQPCLTSFPGGLWVLRMASVSQVGRPAFTRMGFV